MEPKFVSRPEFKVAGLVVRHTPDSQKIGELWGQFFARQGELHDVVEPNVAYGIMTNYDESTGEFDYIAACQVADGQPLPMGFVALDVPAAEFVVFTTTFGDLAQTYPYIYNDWLPKSGYRHGPAPEFELYGETFDPANPASTFDVYIPVVKA